MIDSATIKNITIRTVKDSFYRYFSDPKKETRHILLDRLFPEERRKSSTMSGLQTSLGSFWERLAGTFAQSNNFELINNSFLLRPTPQPEELTGLIDKVKSHRQNQGGNLDNLRTELDLLYPAPYEGNDEFTSMQKGKGADIILKKNDIIYIFDLKTVQVNANNGNTFNETIILWICFYKYKYRVAANNIQAKIVFPYNSSDENNDQAWWTEFRGRISPLTCDEVSVGNEFWKFITGNEDALAAIISGFDEISSDVVFKQFYMQVFECVDYAALKGFSIKVKIKRAEDLYKIQLIEGQALSARSKLNWTHMIDGENCNLRERIGALQDGRPIICNTCNRELP